MYVLYISNLCNLHTSLKNGISITFPKLYVEMHINGISIMHSQTFTFKNQVITYKCFWVCVHHVNDYHRGVTSSSQLVRPNLTLSTI